MEKKKAIIGSILKWVNIAFFGGEDRGSQNCPLCRYSQERTEEYGNICYACPICQYSDKIRGCRHTPFRDWRNHIENEHPHLSNRVHCPTCQQLAIEELEYLFSVLEKNNEEKIK